MYNESMADQEPKFEHAALEKEIGNLAAEVRKRVSPETSEIKREDIGKILSEKIYPADSTSSRQDDSTQKPSPALPNYLQQASSEVKLEVEELVDLAWHKGVARAVKEARKKGKLYVDALHDVLTDKLYQTFKDRGLL